MEFSGQYLTYTEYKELGGLLEEMPFNLLEFEARQYIDKYTFGRLKNLLSQVDEVKLCMYKLINVANSYKNLEEQDRALASENIDGYSYSYNSTSNSVDSSIENVKSNEMSNIIRTYLIDCKLEDGTPYLYRGV